MNSKDLTSAWGILFLLAIGGLVFIGVLILGIIALGVMLVLKGSLVGYMILGGVLGAVLTIIAGYILDRDY